MKKSLKILIPIAIIVAIVFIALTAYVMLAGVGGCPCNFISGKLTQKSISDDGKAVEFVINLTNPYQVTNRSWITILVNASGQVEELKYNSTKNVWLSENYTAEIIDNNNDSVVNTGDILVVHSIKKFSGEDKVGMRILCYGREIWTHVRLS